MECPKCGAQLNDDATFCGVCGNQISSAASASSTQQPYSQQPYSQPTYGQPPYGQNPNNQQPYGQVPYGGQAPYGQPMYQQPPVPGKGFGIAGMVLGIVSLVFVCLFYPVSFVLAIVGAVLSVISSSKAKAAGMKNGMAVAGLVCSLVSLAFALIVVIIFAGEIAFLASL